MKDTRAAVMNSLKQLISANLLTKKEYDGKVDTLEKILKDVKPDQTVSYEQLMEELGIVQLSSPSFAKDQLLRSIGDYTEGGRNRRDPGLSQSHEGTLETVATRASRSYRVRQLKSPTRFLTPGKPMQESEEHLMEQHKEMLKKIKQDKAEREKKQ